MHLSDKESGSPPLLYNQLTMILIQEALRRSFDIDEIVMIERLEAGPLATIFRAELRIQGKKRTVSIKRHRGKNLSRMRFEADLAGALNDHNFKLTPPVILTSAGDPWFCCGDDYYFASPWIDAEDNENWLGFSQFNQKRSETAARALADFHVACKNIDERFIDSSAPMPANVFDHLSKTIDRSLSSARAPSAEGDELIGWLDEIANQLQAHLRETLRKAAAIEMDSQLVHGDFHAGNVLFRHGKVVGILDLEYFHRGCRLSDVAYGALMFSIGKGETEERLVGERSHAFACAYNQQVVAHAAGCLNIIELQNLPLFFKAAAMVVAFWLIDQYVCHCRLRSPILPRLRNVVNYALMPIEADRHTMYS